ncbi:hypothetical protein [Candidatus Deianiraea vastatrix]|nr:hypothetical protein [Candidatus Deianiraea vastatrix]
MNSCELNAVNKAIENAKLFCISLKDDKLVSDHFGLVTAESARMFSKKGLIDYKDLAIATDDKKSFNIVDKMFKNRKKYRDSLTKNDSDCLKSGVRKLTIEQKIDVCGGYFVMI